MLPEELNISWRKYKNNVFIYSWKYFSKRIHEELLRSALEESPFFYVEINFSIIERELPLGADRLKFWGAFFDILSTEKRYCDLCGFLKNNDGIAFLFINSNLNIADTSPVWNRFCTQMQIRTCYDMQKWEGIIYAEYPPKEFFAKK
jgi:hypothetical protein